MVLQREGLKGDIQGSLLTYYNAMFPVVLS